MDIVTKLNTYSMNPQLVTRNSLTETTMMPSLKQQINWLLRDKYHNKITPAAKKDIARLRQGEPLDYIIGWREFLGHKIDLSLRPLIPCQETEFWVNEAIKSICHSDTTIQCLDLFSGSGCIGVAILKHIPQAKVDFTDIDKHCLKQIKINLKINKIAKSRYHLFQTDIFNPVLKTTCLRISAVASSYGKASKLKIYNYIFANPPYIALRNKTKLQKSVLKYEPHQALFAKQNGLYFIDQTLCQAKKYLKPNGQLFLEFSPEQKSAITVLLKKYQYNKWRFNKDQFNRWRYLKTQTS